MRIRIHFPSWIRIRIQDVYAIRIRIQDVFAIRIQEEKFKEKKDKLKGN